MKRGLRTHADWLGLAAAIVLTVSACGGGEGGEEVKARTLRETRAGKLPAGRYVSDEFEPAMSFRLGEGWQVPEHSGEWLETQTNLSLIGSPPLGAYWLEFMTIPKVYEIVSSSEARAQPVPQDIVAWLQQHTYLNTEKPKQIRVGGERSQQLDVAPSSIPQDFYGSGCPEPCLPLFEVVAGDEASMYELFEDDKVRFIVVGDVKGTTVTIGILGPAKRFEEFLLKAQNVLDTVEWKE
jgi:hypothetical protein